MSLSTGSRELSAQPPAPATMAVAHDLIEATVSASLDEVMTHASESVRPNDAWPRTGKWSAGGSSPALSISEAHQRRRLAAPLLDFVSALRGAIAAFGQGQTATRRELTLRQVANTKALLRCPLGRSATEATRILYLGDLSPQSGVVDLLSCLISWAEEHRDVAVDICWAGSGDLQGVLRAQSKPPNLTQSFTRLSDTETVAALTADRGILAVPNLGFVDLFPIAQAMAAGLPILGSTRCPEARMLVRSSATGWLFDPLSPTEMSAALDAALSAPPSRLAEMRAAARRRLSALCDEWLDADDEAGLRRHSTQLATRGTSEP